MRALVTRFGLALAFPVKAIRFEGECSAAVVRLNAGLFFDLHPDANVYMGPVSSELCVELTDAQVQEWLDAELVQRQAIGALVVWPGPLATLRGLPVEVLGARQMIQNALNRARKPRVTVFHAGAATWRGGAAL